MAIELKSIIDIKLTPQDSAMQGYKYIEDIRYNILASANDKNDILRLVIKAGYKIGTPMKANKPCYGLYAPVKKSLIQKSLLKNKKVITILE